MTVTRVVGLTGGIGCGKSVVAQMLAERGASIIDADVLAREAVAPGSRALDAIRARFGDGMFDTHGALDRKALGVLVFADETARSDLDAIVHPEVGALAAQRIEALREAGAEVVVYDVPLLYENGLDRFLSEVVVVSVPPHVQRGRIAARDGLAPEQIQARIDAQMPLADKAARAQHIIDNGGTLGATRAQVDALWERLSGGTAAHGGTNP